VQIGNEERLTRTQIPIIRSVISLAKELDMSVIAEGVETKQELERLISLDCKYAQGYFFGAPMSYKEFHKKLSAQFAKAK